MKKLLISLLFIFLLSSDGFSETIASYNCLRLGQSKKDYPTLAKTISQFDITGLIEVMNVEGLIRLVDTLNTNSKIKWNYIISDKKVGRTIYKEYFAYVYKENKISLVRPVGFYEEFADEFEREPYGVYFKMNNFDFTFVLCHLIYGNSINEREEEARNLVYVYEYFRKMTSDDKDVIIAGDFNLGANNEGFIPLIQRSGSIHYMINPTFKTTIGATGLVNSYDNIFISIQYTWEAEYGAVFVPDIADYKIYRKTVSDHLPVYIKVKTTFDDD